jgi:hypothetical protein
MMFLNCEWPAMVPPALCEIRRGYKSGLRKNPESEAATTMSAWLRPHTESLTQIAVYKINAFAQDRHARPCAGHPRLQTIAARKSWMAGTSPAMTAERPQLGR